MSSSASGQADDDDGGGGGDARDWQLFQLPENEVPAVVPLSLVLARTPDLAVVVDALRVHRRGFAFTLGVLMRRDPGHRSDVFQQIAGHGPGGEQLLLGVEFADGRRAANTSGMPPRLGSSAGRGLTLVAQGGGGGGRRYGQDFWVTSLPPAGRLRFVLRWDAQQVEETVVDVDGGLVVAAAERVEELWPWEPEEPTPWEPEPPVLPADGWFAVPQGGPGSR